MRSSGDPEGQTCLILEPAREGGPLPGVLWWGPSAALGPSGTTARDVLAARRHAGPATALLVEHARGLYLRPSLRGHRIGEGSPVAWSPAFQVTASTVRRPVDDPATPHALGVEIESEDRSAGLTLRTDVEGVAGGLVRVRHRLTSTARGRFVVDGLEVSVPLPADAIEILDFTGGHLHERTPQRHAVRDGLWLRENRRGKTGLDASGTLHVGTPGFGFNAGRVWTAHVGWSGNSVLRVERSSSTITTFGGGELLLPGEVVLAEGDSYTTPWVYLSAGSEGLDGCAHAFHTCVRAEPSQPAKPVPVTLNVWEAVWFDHDLARLRELAELGAEIGVERFVLDDGWFGARRDDRAGLGDWTPSDDAWPTGLDPLIETVHELGMQFGLWFEPEMVNPDSDLFRAHPDWVLSTGDRRPLLERHQLALDLSRDDVRAHVRDAVSAVLSAHRIDYVKWDHNRDLLEAGSATRGGAPAVHGNTHGFYLLLDELRRQHPHIEWESCASGGGRVDIEVLRRVERVWTSDMTDALARQHIQRWMTQLVPPEYLGAHVSAPTSHQTGRSLPLELRVATALFGAFGIEWDLTTATADERRQLRTWVEVYKRYRRLLHGGRTVRVDTPDATVLIHGVLAQDRSEALMAYVQLDEPVHEVPVPLTIPGLDPRATYHATWVTPSGADAPQAAVGRAWASTPSDGPAGDHPLSGAILGEIGLTLPRRQPLTVTLVHLARTDPIEDRSADQSGAEPSTPPRRPRLVVDATHLKTNGQPTIKDVAREAAVSYSTVSRAVRGVAGMSEPTRKRVLAAAAKLNYIPSLNAAGLAGGRTNTVAVLTPHVSGWFYTSCIDLLHQGQVPGRGVLAAIG